MKALADYLWELDPIEAGELVPILCAEGMRDAKQARLCIQMNNLKERRLVIASLKELGAVHRCSQAPAGYMEDQVSQMIQAIKSNSK